MSETLATLAELNTQGIEFRNLNIDEISPLLSESDHAFLPPADNPEQTATALFANLQSDPRFYILGYVSDNTPVSYAVALSHKDPTTLALGPMYVANDLQGQGLGLKQVEAFITYAKDNGYKSVFTKTWSENSAPQAIFDKAGFQQVGITHGDRANGDDSVKYMLNI